jgi:hypothetical protein
MISCALVLAGLQYAALHMRRNETMKVYRASPQRKNTYISHQQRTRLQNAPKVSMEPQRWIRHALIVWGGMLFLTAHVTAAQTKALPTRQTSPTRDATAISLAQKALSTAGGSIAIANVQRWKATGNVAYPSSKEAPVQVTIQATSARKYREDLTLPSGVQSLIASNGTVSRKGSDGIKHGLRPQHADNLGSVLLPARILAAALSDTSMVISDKGMQTIDGKQLHEIDTYPGSAHTPMEISRNKCELFVDPASLQIVLYREYISQDFRYSPDFLHEYVYSDFHKVAGIVAPFTIVERLMGREVSTLTVQQLDLNPDIADAAFNQ